METATSFEEFKEKLKNYEIDTFSKFIVYKSEKNFLNENFGISPDSRLHWKEGTPYYLVGKRVYICHKGKDKNFAQRKKYFLNKEKQVNGNNNIDSLLLKSRKPSKKSDCPASITVTRVYLLPQFTLKNPTRSARCDVSVEIKKLLTQTSTFEVMEAFWYSLPSPDVHKNHPLGELAAKTEPVDPIVRSKIKELAREGERNASIISEIIENYVTTNLNQFDKRRRRFFPDISTIKDTVKTIKMQDKKVNVIEVQGEKKIPAIKVHVESIEENFNFNDCHDDGPVPEISCEKGEDESKKIKLMKQCNLHIRKLRSVMRRIPESELLELAGDLQGLTEKMQMRMKQANSSGLNSDGAISVRSVEIEEEMPTQCIDVIVQACPDSQHSLSSSHPVGGADYFTDYIFQDIKSTNQ